MRPQTGKQKIINAAIKLFEKQGYFATTVEQVTKEAGVSKGLVYNYFPSKESLLVALIEAGTDKIETVANKLDLSGSIEDSIQVFINHFVAFLQKEKRFLKLQLSMLTAPELKTVVTKPQRARALILLDHTTQWFTNHGIEEPQSKARMFLALLDGIALHYLMIFTPYPIQEMQQSLTDAAIKLCRD